MEGVKKSYNPFKMWGSWVGLIIGSIPLSLLILHIYKDSVMNFLANLDPTNCSGNDCGPFPSFALPIVLFFIGWGIHSLIRKLKK